MKHKIIKLLILFIPLILITGCNEEKKEDAFLVKYQNVDITPGNIFDSNTISLSVEKSEVPDCAFSDTGTALVYTYEDLEITTDNNNKIYSVYYISPNISTKEGLSLGDKEEKIIDLYGKDYKKDSNEYKYIKNGITLSIIVNNNTIKSIEYLKEG